MMLLLGRPITQRRGRAGVDASVRAPFLQFLQDLDDEILVLILVRLPVRAVVQFTRAAAFIREITGRADFMSWFVLRQREALHAAGVPCELLPNESLGLRYLARLSGGLNEVPAWFVRWIVDDVSSLHLGRATVSWECVKCLWHTIGSQYFTGLLQFWPHRQSTAGTSDRVFSGSYERLQTVIAADETNKSELHTLLVQILDKAKMVSLQRTHRQPWDSHVTNCAIGASDLAHAMQAAQQPPMDVVDQLVDAEDEDDDENDVDWVDGLRELRRPSREVVEEEEDPAIVAEAEAIDADEDAILEVQDRISDIGHEMEAHLPDMCDNPMCPCLPSLCCGIFLYKDVDHDTQTKPPMLWTFGRRRYMNGRVWSMDCVLHHPTLEILLDELLTSLEPQTCARAHMLRSIMIEEGGHVCMPCD